MGEGAIGLGHAVGIFPFLHRPTPIVGRLQHLIGQPLNHRFFPACPRCGSLRVEWTTALGSARVHTWTVIHGPTLPAFAQPERWMRMMRASIAMAGEHFTSDRMVREYFARLYVPAESRFAAAARL